MKKSAFLTGGVMPSSVNQNMIDALMEQQASNEAHVRDAEPGLIDVSAFITPRAMFGGMFKNPLTGPMLKKVVPNPKLWRRYRKANNNLMIRGSMAGSGVAAGSELVAGE